MPLSPDGMSLTPTNRDDANLSGFGGRQSANMHLIALVNQITSVESSTFPASTKNNTNLNSRKNSGSGI